MDRTRDPLRMPEHPHDPPPAWIAGQGAQGPVHAWFLAVRHPVAIGRVVFLRWPEPMC